jgi:hypothetical protein
MSDHVGVDLLLTAWACALVAAMVAAVLTAVLLPREKL